MAGPVGVLRNRDPAEFWVTFWVTAAGSGEPGGDRYAPAVGAVNVDMSRSLGGEETHANAAWLVLAVIAFNLTRTAATIAGSDLARATTATIRRTLIAVPARVASSADGSRCTYRPPGPGRRRGPACSRTTGGHRHQS